jgi:hypothetical protein
VRVDDSRHSDADADQRKPDIPGLFLQGAYHAEIGVDDIGAERNAFGMGEDHLSQQVRGHGGVEIRLYFQAQYASILAVDHEVRRPAPPAGPRAPPGDQLHKVALQKPGHDLGHR